MKGGKEEEKQGNNAKPQDGRVGGPPTSPTCPNMVILVTQLPGDFGLK